MKESIPVERSARTELLWAAAFGGAAALFAALVSRLVFGGMPHVQDSIAQLFQARIFAGGRLWAPSPPRPEFFEYSQMINDGRWYSQYPPGHPLLLVPGVWLGIPWLINPLLGGLAVLAICLLAGDLFGPRHARVAGALGVLSPFLILMAAEFMSHVSALCFLSFFLLFYFRMLRTRRTRHGVTAGLCLGFAILIRPYSAFGFALPAAIQCLWLLLRRSFPNPRPILALGAGALLGGVAVCLYNWGTTGDPLTAGYIKLYGPSHGLGFGKGTWGRPHTLVRGLTAAWISLVSLNGRLFEWPGSSLWPLLLALIPGRGGLDSGRKLRWFLASIPLSLLAAYVFYWYHDLCFGPRYLYEALGPILILSACGLVGAGRWLSEMLGPRLRGGGRGLLPPALGLALFAVAGATGWPRLFRTPDAAPGAAPGTPPRMGSYFQHFSPDFWGVGPDLHRTVEAQEPGPALVFTHFAEDDIDDRLLSRMSPRERLPRRDLWFGSAFAWEQPDLAHARIIYAHDRGSENARLASLFPGRRVYLYTGNIEQGTLARLPALEGTLR